MNLKNIFRELNTSRAYILLIGLVVYYQFSIAFVHESLLHLTPGRLDSLESFPFHVRSDAIESFTVYITLFLCAIIFYEFYNLDKGNISQSKYNLRIQILAIVVFSPMLSYLILQILWLFQTDDSWDFDIEFMGAIGGWELTNYWPFSSDTIDTATRWEFYHIGLFSSVRVVIASIVLSTLLGIVIGVLRLSRNKLLSNLARVYVDLFRNLPLIVQLTLILVWFATTLDPFREIQDNNFLNWFFWSNGGFFFPKVVISNMFLFLVSLGTFLLFRIYTRFSERIFTDKEDTEETNLKVGNMEDLKNTFKFLIFRPFYFLDKRLETLTPDILFSLSILSVTFGIFRILEWNYSFTFSGILVREPFSLFVFGLILLFYSSKMVSALELEGLNTFTEDSRPEAIRRRLQLSGVVILSMVIFLYLSISVTQPNLIIEEDGKELPWGKWKFEEGTYEEVNVVFLNLMFCQK